MKRVLLLLPVLALGVACADNTVTGPELAVTEDLGVDLPAYAKRMDVKMVPVKIKGTWQGVLEGNPAPCARWDDAFPQFIEFEGTGTHMGRFVGTATNCVSSVDGTFLSQTSWMTAANGDMLFTDGTWMDDPPIEASLDPGVSFEIAPSRITGGTGRFLNAVGVTYLKGDYSAGMGGNYSIHGEISSVGSTE